ncbi:MAG: glycine cleavage system aminomethyltransferase GcvT [Thermogutta sp.]
MSIWVGRQQSPDSVPAVSRYDKEIVCTFGGLLKTRRRHDFYQEDVLASFTTDEELRNEHVTDLKRTALIDWHREHGAKLTPFAGWEMPLHYQPGILQEHLTVRRFGGLFDVSHMGRFRISGPDTVRFLQYALTSDVSALAPWRAQYTILAKEDGSAIDDAYLFRFGDEYWLVVNAANRDADWEHLKALAEGYSVRLEDLTSEVAMFALQGPCSERLLSQLLKDGHLPEGSRNSLSTATVAGATVRLSRTGYTGEPIGFEIFVASEEAASLWEALAIAGEALGILPIGLGARDTLRLEAGLTLFGHELGTDQDGQPIPILAAPSANVAVSLAEHKGNFCGRQSLESQIKFYRQWREGRPQSNPVLPRLVRPIAILSPGVARQGDAVVWNGKAIGWATSGTMVPYWVLEEQGQETSVKDQSARRSIALALIDIDVPKDAEIEVVVRGRPLKARIVPNHGLSNRPPYFRPVIVQ